jgi:hypothetical protein
MNMPASSLELPRLPVEPASPSRRENLQVPRYGQQLQGAAQPA